MANGLDQISKQVISWLYFLSGIKT